MTLKEKLQLAELRLPLPALAQSLGLVISERPGPKCSSPFRQDNNFSWSWSYAEDGRARWKDWTTWEGGDCAGFLAKARGLTNREAVKRYLELAGVSDTDSGPLPALKPIVPKPILLAKAEPKEKPKLPEDLHKGTEDEIVELLRLRDWDVPVEHLDEVSSLGFLRFGTWQGERAWFLVDPAGRFFEARRMDGQKWAHGGKSDSRGSKSLLGAELVKPGSLALLLEGAPDFLACSIYKSLGRVEGPCFADDAVPVAFFGSGLRFSPEELERFKGVRVIVLPHLDPAGRNARDIWKAQLRKAGASVGDVCLQKFVSPGGKDLSDTFFPYFNESLLWRIEGKAEQLREENK
jgi:hypothetical protein